MHPHLCTRCQKYFTDFSALKRHLSRHVNRFFSASKYFQRPGLFGKECHIKYYDLGLVQDIVSLKGAVHYHDFAQRKKHKKKKRKRKYLNGERVHSCKRCQLVFCSKHAMKSHKNLGCLKRKHIVDAFECKFCYQIYETQSMLNNHQKIHYHSCILCNAMFTSKNILRNHMRTHSNKQSFTNNTCNTSYAAKPVKLSQSSLNKLHNQSITELQPRLNSDYWPEFQRAEENIEINIHDDKIENHELYNCDMCSRTLASETSRDIHQRAHDSVLSENMCPCCDMMLSTSEELDQHFYIHSGNNTNPCSFCDKKFTQVSKLISHEANHISGHENLAIRRLEKVVYECDLCKEKFLFPTGLSKHARRTHKGFRPFNCDKCNNRYILKSDLTRHLSLHSGESFKCSYCPKVFTEKRYLETHKKIHTGKGFQKCQYCPKLYAVKDLKYHERSHTGEKPYICKTCQKPYASNSALRYHERAVHGGGTYFECEHCQRRYYQKSDFVIHLRTHTGERPYKCEDCDKTFRSAMHLMRHKRRIHGGKEELCENGV